MARSEKWHKGRKYTSFGQLSDGGVWIRLGEDRNMCRVGRSKRCGLQPGFGQLQCRTIKKGVGQSFTLVAKISDRCQSQAVKTESTGSCYLPIGTRAGRSKRYELQPNFG